MNTSDKCGACGTPKGKNRFKEDDCPKCNSENFVGFSTAEKEVMPIKEKAVVIDEIKVEEEEIV